MAQNEDARTLIKEEALKQIDFDYGVLYSLVKDRKLNNGKTFEECLKKYITSAELDHLNEQIPNLTIFVPSLPENSFSAHKWNTRDEAPAVAVKLSDNNEVIIYYVNGETEIIPSDIIPAFPIVVVKEIERITKNKVLMYIGNKSSFGNELNTIFRLKPEQLFDAKYEIAACRPDFCFYRLTGLKAKRAIIDLPLFEWNLENYGSSVKISIEELDGTETSVNATTTSVEFASNFGFDIGLGEKVKIGTKFGSSVKETLTMSYTVTKTKGSDELGEVIVNFADPVVTGDRFRAYDETNSEGKRYLNHTEPTFNSKYYTGWYRLYISPKNTNL